MRKIERYPEPDFWREYKRKHPGILYKDLNVDAEGKEVRKKIRQYLVESQKGLCAYCCKGISEKESLNEHIKPQGREEYAGCSMDYDNLVASCDAQGAHLTCSAKKGNKYDEKLFVSPLDDGCEKHFEFYPNGQVAGTTKEGQYTCDLLGLNSYALQGARKATYKVCRSYGNSDLVREYMLEPREGKMEPFSDMIEYFYRRGDFEVREILY